MRWPGVVLWSATALVAGLAAVAWDGLSNWWRAEPWRWHFRAIYRTLRSGSAHPRTGEWLPGGEPKGRLAAVWGALVFPHVHDDE